MNRKKIKQSEIDDIIIHISKVLKEEFNKKGYHSSTSSHELLGIITEEYDELKDAIRDNNIDNLKEELEDMAIASLYGLLSIKYLDW